MRRRKPSANLAAMRVRHLLSMSTGHDEDTTERIWSRSRTATGRGRFWRWPVAHTAGHPFPLQHRRHLHAVGHHPESDRADAARLSARRACLSRWASRAPRGKPDPRGINTGGLGLNIKTEDIARFGQLYLQKGMWQGKRLLPEAWVDEASRNAGGQRRRAQTRLAAGLRLSVLALPAQRLPRRWRVRPVSAS